MNPRLLRELEAVRAEHAAALADVDPEATSIEDALRLLALQRVALGTIWELIETADPTQIDAEALAELVAIAEAETENYRGFRRTLGLPPDGDSFGLPTDILNPNRSKS